MANDNVTSINLGNNDGGFTLDYQTKPITSEVVDIDLKGNGNAPVIEEFELDAPPVDNKTKKIKYKVKGIDEVFELEITEEEYEKYKKMSKKEQAAFIRNKYPKNYFKELIQKHTDTNNIASDIPVSDKKDKKDNNELYSYLSEQFGDNPQEMKKVMLNGADGEKEVTFTPGNQRYYNKLIAEGDYKELEAFLKRMYKTGGPYFKIERRRNNFDRGVMYWSYCLSDDARPVEPDYKSGKNYTGLADGLLLHNFTEEKSGLDLEINWYEKDGIYYPISSDPNVKIFDENGNELESDYHNVLNSILIEGIKLGKNRDNANTISVPSAKPSNAEQKDEINTKTKKEKMDPQTDEWYQDLAKQFGDNPQEAKKIKLNGTNGEKEVTFTAGNQRYYNKVLASGDTKELKAFLDRMYKTGGPYFKIEKRRLNGKGGVMYWSYCLSDDARPVEPDYKTGKCYTGTGDGLVLHVFSMEKDGIDLEINWYEKDGMYYPITSDPNIRIIDENGNELESDYHKVLDKIQIEGIKLGRNRDNVNSTDTSSNQKDTTPSSNNRSDDDTDDSSSTPSNSSSDNSSSSNNYSPTSNDSTPTSSDSTPTTSSSSPSSSSTSDKGSNNNNKKEKMNPQTKEWYEELAKEFGDNPQEMKKVKLDGTSGEKEVVFTPGNQEYYNKLLAEGNEEELKAFMDRMYKTGGPYFKIEKRRLNGKGGVMYWSYCFSDDARPVEPDGSGKNYTGTADGVISHTYTAARDGLDLQINWYEKDGMCYPISNDPNVRIIDENGNLLESDYHNVEDSLRLAWK